LRAAIGLDQSDPLEGSAMMGPRQVAQGALFYDFNLKAPGWFPTKLNQLDRKTPTKTLNRPGFPGELEAQKSGGFLVGV